jgi:hypothetical protein
MLLGLISGWIIRPALEPAISGNRYLPFAQYEFTEDQQLEMKLSLEDTSIKYRFDRKNRLVLRGRDSVYEFYAWLNENMTEVDSEYVLGHQAFSGEFYQRLQERKQPCCVSFDQQQDIKWILRSSWCWITISLCFTNASGKRTGSRTDFLRHRRYRTADLV